MSLFFSIARPVTPERYLGTVGYNFLLIFGAGTVLLIAFLFPIERYPLGYCVFLHLTGIPCPTCGFTRAFGAFAHGNFAKGIMDCPFAFLIFSATVFVFAYNVLAALIALFGFRLKRGVWLQLSPRKITIISGICILLLAANWVYRLILGIK